MARTEGEEEKWQTYGCCRDQQKSCRKVQASAEKLEYTGSAEKKRVASVPQREQLESTPEPRLPIKKRNKALCPDHQIVRWEIKMSESRILARKKEN